MSWPTTARLSSAIAQTECGVVDAATGPHLDLWVTTFDSRSPDAREQSPLESMLESS
ncbi:hypothetical protein [Natrinema hispanicum]|uniref:hypothetical protein n=1 Tax=Natrinema hispanicum TaxID=392421 RepID=UPI0013EE740A|nr:hypothetical protein [Natrinema hispanicum]